MSASPRSFVVATAGHVDHGKSSLVLALTGTDPDRWAEEKARGLTIDLGFAHFQLDPTTGVSLVDVPGHIRFIKNMLAGVGGVDACLFIVAATEGWKPQSEEHLRILQLLGLTRGVIVLTKVDLVDGEWQELARLDIADRVAGTFLETAEVIGVDSLRGEGLSDVRSAIGRMLLDAPTSENRLRPRLWVDRSFAAKGAGTVVTGTLTGGPLRVDDQVAVEGQAVRGLGRIRSLQSHGHAVAEVAPGTRVAVNLAGIDHEAVARGAAIVRDGQWHACTRFDASFTALASLGHEVSRRGAFAVYLGSGEHAVKVRILGTHTIAPGADGFVRIHLPTSLPLLPGDRFILRDHGREETVGGGEILDVAPVRAASKAKPSRAVSRVVAERGWIPANKLELLTGEQWDGPLVGERWVASPEALEQETERVRMLVLEAGPLGLDVAVLDERARAVLGALEGVVTTGGRATLGTAPDPLADHPFVGALRGAPFSPPDATAVNRTELRELVRRGLVVERDGVHFAPEAITAAAHTVAVLLSTRPQGVTVAEVRDALATTRKHVLPLLAHLDATGITRRRGDLRIGGPKLPAG